MASSSSHDLVGRGLIRVLPRPRAGHGLGDDVDGLSDLPRLDVGSGNRHRCLCPAAVVAAAPHH